MSKGGFESLLDMEFRWPTLGDKLFAKPEGPLGGGRLLDGEVVVVANQVPGILHLYHGSQWANGAHRGMLRRLDGVKPAGNRRFAGLQSKATAIPWATLMPDE